MEVGAGRACVSGAGPCAVSTSTIWSHWVSWLLFAGFPVLHRTRLFFILFVLLPSCALVSVAVVLFYSDLQGFESQRLSPPWLCPPALVPFVLSSHLFPYLLLSSAYLLTEWCCVSSSSLLSLNFCVCVCVYVFHHKADWVFITNFNLCDPFLDAQMGQLSAWKVIFLNGTGMSLFLIIF